MAGLDAAEVYNHQCCGTDQCQICVPQTLALASYTIEDPKVVQAPESSTTAATSAIRTISQTIQEQLRSIQIKDTDT